jgi:hypothetical protein
MLNNSELKAKEEELMRINNELELKRKELK